MSERAKEGSKGMAAAATLTLWRGILETYDDCEAETEQEAEKKMAEQLIKRLQSGEITFVVWGDPDTLQERLRKPPYTPK